MVEQAPGVGFEREASEPEGEGFDAQQARELAGFAIHATRRRPKLTALTFLTISTLGVAIAAVMPRTYAATVKLLAQRATPLRAISSTNQAVQEVDPLKNVGALITRQDNLMSLVRESNLVARHNATRSAALKFKDHLIAKVFGAPTEDVMQIALEKTLETRIEVTVDEPTASLAITVDWPDPRLAYDLVTLLQKNFLEARYDSDVAVVTESISVLEDHAKTELTKVDEQLAAYQKVLAERSVRAAPDGTPRPRPRTAYAAPAPRAPGAIAPSPEPVEDPTVAKQLEETRARLRDAEEQQSHAVENVRQQLIQAQLTLTPMHPTVIGLQQQLDAVSQPTPEITALREKERALMAQLAPPRPIVAPSAAAGSATTPRTLAAIAPEPMGAASAEAADAGAGSALFLPMRERDEDRDGVIQLAQSQLQAAIRSYEDAMQRVDSAKVELDVTRAAYKYKYTVVKPAEIPEHPKKPIANIVAIASVLGGGLIAILLAAIADLAKGRFLESWQIRRRLKLDVLGEIDMPALDAAAPPPGAEPRRGV